jgi:hypothetical protein
VERIMRRYGGWMEPLFRLRARREESFQRERDRRPETWHIQWHGIPRSAVRDALGCMIGEILPPPPGQVPSIVPS